MTPEEAAWVRGNAWTLRMRRQPWGPLPSGGYTYDHAQALSMCECMEGVCWHCRDGKHQFCARRRVRPQPEWWLQNRPLDYVKPTAVWLADRACRSLCPCCPAGQPRPVPRFERVPLFDLATP